MTKQTKTALLSVLTKLNPSALTMIRLREALDREPEQPEQICHPPLEDPTRYKFPVFFSPNPSLHISNLERALSEVYDSMLPILAKKPVDEW